MLLSAAGVEQPLLDARLLLMAVAGLRLEDILREPGAELLSSQAEAFEGLVARRAGREPVSRILGRREFWSLEFEVSPDTLDPRADSETLISAVCETIKDRRFAFNILDIGTGTGCLLLALLSEFPAARGIGIDISAGALAVAVRNAQRLGFMDRTEFLQCDVMARDWMTRLDGKFDLVLSNPPYISDSNIAGLAPEVTQFDPPGALAGGADGLDFYRIITHSLPHLLKPDGWAVLETGAGQAEAVERLMQQAGLAIAPRKYDLGGVARAVIGKL